MLQGVRRAVQTARRVTRRTVGRIGRAIGQARAGNFRGAGRVLRTGSSRSR